MTLTQKIISGGAHLQLYLQPILYKEWSLTFHQPHFRRSLLDLMSELISPQDIGKFQMHWPHRPQPSHSALQYQAFWFAQTGMIRVGVPSEVVNVVNFFFLDIILLSYALFLSSKLAGFFNEKAISEGSTVNLVEYNFPVIGGGMVMSPGWWRRCLIGVRLAVVIFVAVANLGIEGRTIPNPVRREAIIRVPGPLKVDEENILTILRDYKECNVVQGDRFVMGSVIDNKCFPEIKDYVIIYELFATRIERAVPMDLCTMTAKNCERTVFKCEKVDLYCDGVSKDKDCADAQGIIPQSCFGVIYDDEKGGGYICESGNIASDSQAQLNQCREFLAKREVVAHWDETFEIWNNAVDQATLSIFAAAYGVKRMQNVTLLEEPRVVTDISLLWIAPASVTAVVCLALTAYVIFQYCWVGSKAVAHDENGLLKLLGKPVQILRMRDGDNDLPGGEVGSTIFFE